MPVDPRKYPPGWKKISYELRFVIGDGTCESCGAKHGEINKKTGKPVVIMAAHKDHDLSVVITDPEKELRRLCGACHNYFDKPFKLSKEVRNKIKKSGVLTLPFYEI